MVVRAYSVAPRPGVEAVIAAVARRTSPAVLDSADTGPGRGRFTILACDPVETRTWAGDGEDPFEGLRERLGRTVSQSVRTPPRPASVKREETAGLLGPHRPAPADRPERFVGWMGYFAYEAGRFIERLPATVRADVGLPVARFALYDSSAVHDALTGEWTIVTASDRRAAEWRDILAGARPVEVAAPPRSGPAVDNMTHSEYLRRVARAREYIAAGDIFQVNFARRESYEQREPVWQTYLRLRRANPAGYGACFAWEDAARPAILSASPELFLQLDGREVISRPIKGTRPRTDDPAADTAYQAELAGSAKDRAELAMIVDLVRNDLGRVCEYGSVRVAPAPDSPAGPYDLEAHPTVHHLVGTVAGRLAEGRDAIDLVRACFPGGSITGAPKVRAMEIIDELEPTERSVYTGSIGMFGLDGSMTLNIAIRTLIASGGKIHLYAGGGIVADSVPEDEYRETQAKARGMRRALGVR